MNRFRSFLRVVQTWCEGGARSDRPLLDQVPFVKNAFILFEFTRRLLQERSGATPVPSRPRISVFLFWREFHFTAGGGGVPTFPPFSNRSPIDVIYRVDHFLQTKLECHSTLHLEDIENTVFVCRLCERKVRVHRQGFATAVSICGLISKPSRNWSDKNKSFLLTAVLPLPVFQILRSQ
jgi:hypothetical protein